MFGFKSENDIKKEYRLKAKNYLDTQLQNMRGSGALAWFRGALELVESLGLFTEQEINLYDSTAQKRYDAIRAAEKAEKDAILAQRKAERIAKAEKEKMKG